jgi:hypothetical protein
MGFSDLSGTSTYGAIGPVPTPIYQHLDINGDGTGTKNAIGNYTGSAEIFYFQPDAGKIARITRMIVLIRGPKTSFYTDSYGSVGELTNGVTVRVQDDSGTTVQLTNGIPVKTNGNWGHFCFDAEVYPSSVGNNDTYLRVRWTFEKAGYPLRLVGDNNERLEVVLNDDFTGGGSGGLVEHYFHAQGYYEEV